jgi:hypothetical protein
MKLSMILSSAALALVTLLDVAPAIAANGPEGLMFTQGELSITTYVDQIDRRGRRPRVPGGSGCDDPRDLIEHPECRP